MTEHWKCCTDPRARVIFSGGLVQNVFVDFSETYGRIPLYPEDLSAQDLAFYEDIVKWWLANRGT